MNKVVVDVKRVSLSQQWIKAAVIGSIWAAIEIIAGSFLHNLKIPFSGTILSMVAVFMLVAFSMHWNERGIILRAGIIAALMKSISPSAIILGPMVGIMMEAVILEFILLLFGRNIIGYVFGGMLAVSWALIQKIITLLILYSFDLVTIADAFYKFLVNKTGLEHISPLYLIILVVSMYLLAGFLSALAGYISFKRLRHNSIDNSQHMVVQSSENPLGSHMERKSFASFNLFLVLLVLAVSLYLLNSNHQIPALIIGSGLIIFVLIRYKRSIRYLKKASMWIRIMLITLLAALVWEWLSTGELFTVNGLLIGLEINFRALLIIFSFSAISVELRNPVVRSLLYRNGFSNLYKAISLAFSTLPAIIERLPQSKSLFKQRKSTLGKIFQLAEELLIYMDRKPVPHQNIYLVSGKVHSGKSIFIKDFVNACKENSVLVMGIIASGTFKNDKRDSFHLTDISNGESMLLASREKNDKWIRHKVFYFDPKAFIRGDKIMSEGLNRKADILILDEVGPMELAGRGWHKVIEKLDNNYDIPQIWVVREQIVDEVKDRWSIPNENVISIETNNFKDLLNRFISDESKQE